MKDIVLKQRVNAKIMPMAKLYTNFALENPVLE